MDIIFNERISTWADFLSLDKQFWGYSNVSLPKKGFFVERAVGVIITYKLHNFLKINPQNFHHTIFRSKGLFYAKLYGTLYKMLH